MHFWALFLAEFVQSSLNDTCEHNWSVRAQGEEQPRVALAKRRQLFEVLVVVKRRSVEASKR
jgi:hypothetical protein